MTRTVFCLKYQKDLPGLDRPPIPGPKGQNIFEHVSQQAWQDWMAHQTTLLNEKHLNMMDPAARTYLSEQREKFFNGEDYDKAEMRTPSAPAQDDASTDK
ncbi:MAG: oxidative damage protection protein [Alteromonadaceae bacterium]|nr:MAG: oxidative damage protection protein [Alteromonadaceae bacterium]